MQPVLVIAYPDTAAKSMHAKLVFKRVVLTASQTLNGKRATTR